MCPVDLAKLWLCNYEFLSAGEGAASWLASYFEGTAESFIDGGVGDAHPIYSKAGWIWDGPKYFVFNDAGYVDKAGAPYVVAIMSSSGEGCKAQLESLVAHLDAAHDELL